MAPASILIVIAGSAGAFGVLSEILGGLPADLPAAIAIVQHRSAKFKSHLASILARSTRLRVVDATEGIVLEPGTAYVAPPDHHLTVDADHRAHLVDGHRIRFVLSSANPLFESAARVYGPKVLAIVLSGYDSDGTDGVQAVAQGGGVVLAQDPATAGVPDMPRSAVATRVVERVVPRDQLAGEVMRFVAAHQS